jgi:SH2 domain.
MERPHLTGKTWYYGSISRAQCDTILNTHGHDGDFLIRDSETNVSTHRLYWYWTFYFVDGEIGSRDFLF